MSEDFVLHVWPGHWSLPSIDPACLAAVLYLQLAIPDQLTINECTNPDLSPSGQLPFLTHKQHIVASVPSIVKYVASLKTHLDLDNKLSATHLAQKAAWTAYMDTHLGDLVSCTFYSFDSNWWKLTRPALATMLPVPQRYYLPDRIRASHKARLEAADLWGLSGLEDKEETELEEERRKKWEREQGVGKRAQEADRKTQASFKRAFARAKLLEKARAAFGILERVLGDGEYFYSSRPTSLDLTLASHILLLTSPPFPSSPLADLLTSTYPALTHHAQRVLSHASSTPTPTTRPPTSLRTSLSTLFFPYPPAFRDALSSGASAAKARLTTLPRSSSAGAGDGEDDDTDEKDAEAAKFNATTWRILGAVALGAVAFSMAFGPALADVLGALHIGGEGEDDDEDEEVLEVVDEAAVDELEVEVVSTPVAASA